MTGGRIGGRIGGRMGEWGAGGRHLLLSSPSWRCGFQTRWSAPSSGCPCAREAGDPLHPASEASPPTGHCRPHQGHSARGHAAGNGEQGWARPGDDGASSRLPHTCLPCVPRSGLPLAPRTRTLTADHPPPPTQAFPRAPSPGAAGSSRWVSRGHRTRCAPAVASAWHTAPWVRAAPGPAGAQSLGVSPRGGLSGRRPGVSGSAYRDVP